MVGRRLLLLPDHRGRCARGRSVRAQPRRGVGGGGPMSALDSTGVPVARPGRTVSTNGIDLAYSERGSGEPLVLIMGLGADRTAWELHVQAFEKRYRCFVVDNR